MKTATVTASQEENAHDRTRLVLVGEARTDVGHIHQSFEHQDVVDRHTLYFQIVTLSDSQRQVPINPPQPNSTFGVAGDETLGLFRCISVPNVTLHRMDACVR